MPRLIDDIRARGAQMPFFVARDMQADWLKYAQFVMQPLGDPALPVLLVDNVADYYFVGTGQEYWDLRKDFPNLAPPFPHFWCEHKMARRIHSDEKGDNDLGAIGAGKDAKIGVLFVALKPEEVKGEGIPENARWIYWADIFVQYDVRKDDRAQGPHGSIFFAVDTEGCIINQPWMQSYAGKELEHVMRSLMTWLHPSLLSICFLHCKNVVIADETVSKPLAKKHHAKTGQWPVKYKTLIIEPLKQVLRTQGRSGEVGLAKAMHICRGHFRDYREGRGLFGKYHGQFWIPSVVRGTKGKSTPAREIEIKV